MAAQALKSITWRLETHDLIRQGKCGGVFDAPFDYVPNSRCLLLRRLPKLARGSRVTRVYSRKSTATYVNLISPGPGAQNAIPVIVKIMFVAAPEGAADCLLSEHEVEVRMLLLMTALMRRGIMDSATIPLAMGTLQREDLAGSGFLIAGDPIFDDPKHRGDGHYAVIFAEAADTALSSLLWTACLGKAPRIRGRAADSNYYTRAALLQVTLALAAMHAIFPSFRHNDLHASNVLVQGLDPVGLRDKLGAKLPEGYPLLVEYELGGRRWQIDLDRAPFRCLLWDCSFASIEQSDGERAGLDCVTPRVAQFGYHPGLSKTTPNQYCDIQKLVDTLRWVLQQGDGEAWRAGLSMETRWLIDHIAPPENSYADVALSQAVRAQRQMRAHAELQRTSPTRILLIDGLFDDFRVDQLPREERRRCVYRVERRCGERDPRDLLRWQTLQTPHAFTDAKPST